MLDLIGLNINMIAQILVFVPLFAAVCVGFLTKRLLARLADYICTAAVLLSFCMATLVFYHVIIAHGIIDLRLMKWLTFYGYTAHWSIYIDSIGAMMLIAVTFVSALVHLYSIGYMAYDPSRSRFMAYLSLFTFAMIMLVVSDNFVQLFFGWEGVGLCSYLLIGFWYHKNSASVAAMKAFIINRIGDVGLAMGIFFILRECHTLDYRAVFTMMPTLLEHKVMFLNLQADYITLVAMLLFIGCMGKSAQLGLHTWLPDAMEGPTPVSALIHAATMVTAGVFLVVRCSGIYEYSTFALNFITVIGALTAIFAASIAVVQDDIKKIIAYSTCSQLGYMFFACGVSAYTAGIFHLVTHAAFKALLFLGAGSVIHALHDEQNINKMGGLWNKLPYTYALFLIGSLALCGVIPFSGFYSKDAILEAVYLSHGKYAGFAYIIGVIVAFLTAFYSWRLLIKVFHARAPRFNLEKMFRGLWNVSRAQKERSLTLLTSASPNYSPSKKPSKMHEAPWTMMIPLIFLALGALSAGYTLYHYFEIENFAAPMWHGAISVLAAHNQHEMLEHIPFYIEYLPLVAGLFGIGTAYTLYYFMPRLGQKVLQYIEPVRHLFVNKFYFDELYDGSIVSFIKGLGLMLWRVADARIIDGIPAALASASNKSGAKINSTQSGYFYHYALVMIISLLGLMVWCLFNL